MSGFEAGCAALVIGGGAIWAASDVAKAAYEHRWFAVAFDALATVGLIRLAAVVWRAAA